MLYYSVSFQGVSQGTIEDISTADLRAMLDYMHCGKPVTISPEERCTLRDLEDQISLELDIRAWGLK